MKTSTKGKKTQSGAKQTAPEKKQPTTASKSNERASSTSNSVPETNSQNNSTMILSVVILVGVAILGILSIASLVTFSQMNDKIDSLEEKVSRMDNFFSQNARGYGSAGDSGNQDSGNQAPDTQEVSQPDISNRPVLGNEDAPVTIVEYSDFECPFCKRFFDGAYQQLKEEYVETGQAKIVYKDFPLSNIHPLAEPAAISGKCVFRISGSSETFFEYHDTIFNNQNALSEASLKDWALDLGIPESEYDSCIENPEVAAQVEADYNEGTQLGVSGTPSFVINGQLLVGAQPISSFRNIIDEELNN